MHLALLSLYLSFSPSLPVRRLLVLSAHANMPLLTQTNTLPAHARARAHNESARSKTKEEEE